MKKIYLPTLLSIFSLNLYCQVHLKKYYLIKKVFLLLLILVGTGWIFKANSQNGWEEMTPLSSKRTYMGSCVIDHDIYLFGGYDTSGSLAIAEKYNTETGITTPLTDLKFNLSTPTADVINNKIYVVGGFPKGDTGSSLVHEYDPAGDSWTSKKELPLRIGHHTTCVLNNKLYVFGGRLNEGAKKVFQAFVYDPVTDEWDSIAPMHNNQERCRAISCVYDTQMYVFGGFELLNPNIYTNTAEKYDPDKDEWTVIKNMPVAWSPAANLVYNDKIYLFGGDTASNFSTLTFGPTERILEYDPIEDTWKEMEKLPFKWNGNGEQLLGIDLYLLGGWNGTSLLANVWKYSLPLGIEELAGLPVVDPVSIYPNPFDTYLTIDMKGITPIQKIEILSLDGRLVKILDNFQGNSIIINRENLPSGLYFLRIHADEVYLKKVLVH